MASAMSSRLCVGPEQVMFSGSNRITTLARGATSLRSPVGLMKLHETSSQMHGSVFPLVRAPKAPGSMTGLTVNSPISKPTNMMILGQGYGPVAC